MNNKRKRGNMNVLIMIIVIVVVDAIFLGYHAINQRGKKSSAPAPITITRVATHASSIPTITR